MPTGDAVQNVPTAAEEMAKFGGFTTQDGATIEKDTENLNPVTGKPSEDAPAAKVAATPAAKTGAEPKVLSALSDDEAQAALDAAETAAGRELTDDEAATALQAARDAKNKVAGEEKPKKSVQERINKAIRGKNAANQRADAAEARNRTLEARLTALENGGAAPKADLTGGTKAASSGDVAPDPKDFEYGELDAGYIRALARHETRLELADDRAKQTTQAASAQQAQANAEVLEQVKVFENAGAEAYEDFDEIVMQGARDGSWPLSASLGAALLESDHGIHIAYQLAGNPTLAKEIAALSPTKQVAWLGREEAKLDAGSGDKGESGKSEDTAEKPKVTKAPPPVARARGTGAPAQSQSAGSDFAAFEQEAMGRA